MLKLITDFQLILDVTKLKYLCCTEGRVRPVFYKTTISIKTLLYIYTMCICCFYDISDLVIVTTTFQSPKNKWYVPN